ncbi:MAG: ABC transporter [Hyphomicrobiales bacterium]|nr:MAG: ABC transporter [Hyphomicrobiales bacterium]
MSDHSNISGARSAPPFLTAKSIFKSFGGVHALKGVGLDIQPGEVHGLVGANGAGKSTLIRILAGLERPDSGQLMLDGKDIVVENAQKATELGLSFIHQELALVPSMTILENIMLGSKKESRMGMVNWPAIARKVEPIAKRVGLTQPLSTNCSKLSTADNWLVSICRALVHESRLIVMDEPTASLSAAEAERLFAIIRDLSASGVAVLYVSHRLDEILDLCDSVTVFRDGYLVTNFDKASLTRDILVEAIVGGAVESQSIEPQDFSSAEVVLAVQNLSRYPRVRGISFELHKGEVLGLGGLVGAGRSELARLIFGADKKDGGKMMLNGQQYRPKNPSAAVAAGIGFVPEERRTEGLILTKSLAFNVGLANLSQLQLSKFLPLTNQRARSKLAHDTIAALQIKAQGIDAPVGRLSGGNQQKVVIGRWLARSPDILILDEPTRGVDVGARGEIHRLVRQLAADGMSVLVISSEPDELPDLCDRVLIMSEGRIVRELAGDQISRNAIVEASYAQDLAKTA